MLRVLADDHYTAMSFDDLALFADLLNGWLNFHVYLPYLSRCKCVFGLLCSPSYATFCKVVDRYFNSNVVSLENSDIIHTKLTRNVSGHNVTIGQLNFEDGVG